MFQNCDKINPKGIGLGLSISKLITKEFNGTIDVISKYKEGSCFCFTFEIEEFKMIDYLAEVEDEGHELDLNFTKSDINRPNMISQQLIKQDTFE